MGRSPCCSKESMNRGAWTAMEDKILTDYIKTHGEGRWRNLPQKAGLKRCGKSCRLRWLNYLRPDIKRGNISPDEEELIIRLHKLLGNRWSLIAGRLPGRTDNEIKNYWNTNLGKKVRFHTQNNFSTTTEDTNNSSKTPSVITKMPSAASLVVRTKAVKCTKFVQSNSGHKTESPEKGHSSPSSDEDNNNNNNNNSEGSFDILAPPSSDFAVGFDMDELFLADLLMDYGNDVITNCYANVSGSSTPKNDHDHNDDPNHLLLTEESNDMIVTLMKEQEDMIVGPELNSLSSLILDGDCHGDWLAADLLGGE